MTVAGSTDRSAAEAAFAHAVAAGAPLYALVDAARAPDGPREAQRAGVPFQSLLAGELESHLRGVAPYLVDFRSGSSFRHWWLGQFGRSVGVLVEAPVSLAQLRAHFRTLLIIRTDGQQKYYFRFYDPRVLRVFLPSCTPDELRRFFGPIKAFYCEGDGGRELLNFTLTQDGVSVKHSVVPISAR